MKMDKQEFQDNLLKEVIASADDDTWSLTFGPIWTPSMELRWALSSIRRFGPEIEDPAILDSSLEKYRILQQKWQNRRTNAVEWRDIPMVEE